MSISACPGNMPFPVTAFLMAAHGVHEGSSLGVVVQWGSLACGGVSEYGCHNMGGRDEQTGQGESQGLGHAPCCLVFWSYTILAVFLPWGCVPWGSFKRSS